MSKETSQEVRIGLLILAAITMGIGIYSHFKSTWVQEQQVDVISGKPITIKLYKVCKIWKDELDYNKKKCPDIVMERFFVSSIIISFLLSFITFAVQLITQSSSRKLKYFDAGQYVFSSVLLLIGGILYILSAVQIKNLLDPDGTADGGRGTNFLYKWKLAGAILALILSVHHAGVGIVIFKM